MSNGIAAVHWQQPQSGKDSARAYFQDDTDLMLYEIGWDTPEKWYKGNGKRAIGPARRNTPLAVVRANAHYLFYIDTDNLIKEYIYSSVDHKWVPGTTLPCTDPSDNTNLAAVWYGTGKDFEIRLYYQHQSGIVGELLFRAGAWSTGRMWFGSPVHGTKIAVTNPSPTKQGSYSFHHFMVWTDLPAKDPRKYHIFHSMCTNDDWVGENLTPSVSPDGGLSCVSWATGTAGDDYKMRLYFTDADGNVVELGYSSASGWDEAPHKPSHTTNSGSRPLAALAYPSTSGTGMDVAVFVKKEGKAMLEMFSDGGSWIAPKELDWNDF
ncbi:hypothetical protein DFH07DRAFT_1061722 [Mycena maculata]|uniref:Fucose-specific lectin n=1 Tax=Mycena maculata TaxID=230809 RepID=A0AAD7IY63_9AGAR|nr:hypothetical protein DFH07DRAFT_1061722 [Mycena maculata]